MKTVLELIKRARGWHPGLHLKITNEPYMALVIEAPDESGPCGLPAVSVAHYSERNGGPFRWLLQQVVEALGWRRSPVVF